MARLRWVRGSEVGYIELTGPVRFGRAPDNDVVLGDSRVAPRHGVVEPDGRGGWRVVDQGSESGLVVDGVAHRELRLSIGTRFTVGRTTFHFERSSSVDPIGSTLVRTAGSARRPPRRVPHGRKWVVPLLVVACAALLIAVGVALFGGGEPPAEQDPVPPTSPTEPVPTPARGEPATVEPAGAGGVEQTLGERAVELAAGDQEGSHGASSPSGSAAPAPSRADAAGGQQLTPRSTPPPAETDGDGASAAAPDSGTLDARLASEDYKVRWGAYKELKRMGQRPDPIPLWILDLRLHPDPEVRKRSAEKLAAVRDRRAVPQLRESRDNDADPGVRAASAAALQAMGLAE